MSTRAGLTTDLSANPALAHARSLLAVPVRSREGKSPLVALVFVDLPVPAPVAALTIFGLGTRRFLLFGPLASRRRVGASAWSTTPSTRTARTTGKSWIKAARSTTVSRTGCPAKTARTSWRRTRTRRPRRTKTARTRRARRAGARARRSARHRLGTEPGFCRARNASGRAKTTSRTSGRRWRSGGSPHRTWSSRTAGLGLRFLDDDRTALQQASRQLLDRRLGAFVGHGLDEGKPTRATGIPIKGDPNATNLDPLSGECIPELLLVDVVGKISDKKTSTHRTIPVGRSSL
jgi:hypothetical protein